MGRLFYHYTGISGFEAILKSGSLRMTRPDFMNDPNDCRVFLDVVKKYIESKPLERFVMEGGREDLGIVSARVQNADFRAVCLQKC